MVVVLLLMKGFEDNKEGYFNDNDVKMVKEYLKKGFKELGLSKVFDFLIIKLFYNMDEVYVKIV